MNEAYKKQVSLLLDILPEIAKEDAFALHGGTAINLFCLNMPRLSVDIDLTYIPGSEDRNKDLQHIRSALGNIKERIRKQMPNIQFSDPARAEEELKLICAAPDAVVKIEVNQINRGVIAETDTVVLCDKAQETFDKFCEVKIVAALDRQHPRDLFDIKNLINEVGYSSEIKEGFIFFLLCSKRPMHELLSPHLIDQSSVFESQFNGMTTDNSFNYKEYQTFREILMEIVNESLKPEDKKFLLAFAKGNPDWSAVDYSRFPAIKWELLNISRLKKNDPQKFNEQVDALIQILLT